MMPVPQALSSSRMRACCLLWLCASGVAPAAQAVGVALDKEPAPARGGSAASQIQVQQSHRPHHGSHRGHRRTRGLSDAGLESARHPRFGGGGEHEEAEGIENLHEARPHEDTEDPVTLQHEVERMAGRMKRIGVDKDEIEMADQLDDIETSLENSD